MRKVNFWMLGVIGVKFPGAKKKKFVVNKVGWGSKFGTTKCRTTDFSKFQNYEY